MSTVTEAGDLGWASNRWLSIISGPVTSYFETRGRKSLSMQYSWHALRIQGKARFQKTNRDHKRTMDIVCTETQVLFAEWRKCMYGRFAMKRKGKKNMQDGGRAGTKSTLVPQ